MPNTTYVLASLVVMGVVTVLLRWAPFVFVKSLKGSTLVEYLGSTMPVGVMVALIAYSALDRMGFGGAGSTGDPGGLWAAPLALVATITLHLWKKSAVLSILVGTAFYLVLVNIVAA